jgi:tyrosinase
MALDPALQNKVNALLDPLPEGDARDTSFSPFLDEHRELAAELTRKLAATATASGLEAALREAEGGMGGALPGAVKQAVGQLVTHHPSARGVVVVPSVEAVPRPDPPPGAIAAVGTPADSVIPVPNPETLPADERAIDWYREDPLANDHHGHWHKVYPGSGGANGKTQPRQGELFFYMHQQMLARYATERKIAKLPPLVPFEPVVQGGVESYTAPIGEGYGLPGYRGRPSGEQLHDLPAAGQRPEVLVARVAQRHAVIEGMLDSGSIALAGGGTVPLTESFFGASVEPSIPRTADDAQALQFARSGAIHGFGHVLCAEITPQQADDTFLGPMAYFETAISDPFFYRWHGHIDDMYATFQRGAGPNTYERFAADVEFPGDGGEPDIALVLSRDIPGSSAPGFDFAAWAPQAFAPGSPATDLLTTRFTRMSAVVTAGGGTIKTVVDDADLLNHEPFTVFLRLHNRKQAAQNVTVRLFIAHAGLAAERRRWIELDKFKAVLAPGDNVIAQPDARSSVIKRKGVKAPGAQPVGSGLSTWCDCGWPYSLLIPSGESNSAGTPFHLMAAVTAWDQDTANNANTCTSMSFCGSEQFYPDKRNMGYPFDREFPQAGVLATIAAQPSMTVRDVTIRCETPRPT